MVDGDTYYDVHYYSEWLEAEDFKTVRADDEEEARDQFFEDQAETLNETPEEIENRVEIQEVEFAYLDPDLDALPFEF